MTAQIIGLHGPRGAGKDTVAEILERDYGFRRVAFADKLYAEVAEQWGVPEQDLRHPSTKNVPNDRLTVGFCNDTGFIVWYSQSPECLQEITNGEFWMRQARSPRWCLQKWSDYQKFVHRNPYHYVDVLQNTLDLLPNRDIVISDVRYEFEAKFVINKPVSLGIVEVTRPGKVYVNNHSSDTRLPESLIAHHLHNAGDLIELHHRVDELLRSVLQPV